MQTLTSTEEQGLLNGVKQAVDLVDDGMSPDDALTKVARERGWSRGGLRSAVSAFNNGRQVAQWRANDASLDKLAEFPLADYEKIAATIWGATTKEAADHLFGPHGVDPEYSLPPVWMRDQQRDALLTMQLPGAGLEKAAAAQQSPEAQRYASQRNMIDFWNDHQRAKREFEATRTKYAQAHDVVRVQLRLLENYFQKMAMDRLPFHVVEDAATTYHGDRGRVLFDLLAHSFPKEKRAADMRVIHDRPLNRGQAPFPHIDKLLKAAHDVAAAKQEMDTVYAVVEKTAEDLRPFAQTPSQPSRQDALSICLIEGGPEKAAGLGQVAAGGMLGSATRTLMDKALGGAEADKRVDKAWTELEDPDHENELRKIRVQAMLNSMMSDPENPISGHDPDEVLARYNELAQLVPRVSEQPAAVGPLLAQRLAGKTQPFEVNEALNMEKGLKDSKVITPKTRSLLDASESILG